MRLQEASDALFCITFPITLKRFVRIWFFGLQSGSISSFEHLARLFVTYFENNQIQLKNTNNLSTVKQQESESLLEYAAYFNIAILEVKHFNESVIMVALK